MTVLGRLTKSTHVRGADMKSILAFLFAFGLLNSVHAAQIVPTVDNASCTAANQVMLGNGANPSTCVSGGQIPSMGGGRAPSTIYVTTSSQPTLSGGTEQSVFGATGQGPGQTITGGVPYVGNNFYLHASGVATTPIGGGSVTVKVKWGSVAVATLTGAALTISLTNQPWVLDANCSMISVSGSASSSTMTCSGFLFGLAATPLTFTSSSATATVDTVSNQVLDMTWTWTAGVSPSATVRESFVLIRY